jgi:hypothetical protein
MSAIVSFEQQVEIPLKPWTLEEFRGWVQSADFPERGRIDFLSGRIEQPVLPRKTGLVIVLSRRS